MNTRTAVVVHDSRCGYKYMYISDNTTVIVLVKSSMSCTCVALYGDAAATWDLVHERANVAVCFDSLVE